MCSLGQVDEMVFISPILQIPEDIKTLPVSVRVITNVVSAGFTDKIIVIEIILNGMVVETEGTTFYKDYSCLEYGVYVFRVTARNKTTNAIIEQYDLTLDLTDIGEIEIELTNNIGTVPLTFSVEDITNYNPAGFIPLYRRWKILGYGCTGRIEYGVNKRWLTISREGQYDIQLIVSNGVTTYTKTVKNAVIVLGDDYDGNQIEFAENSGEEVRRHLIKTEHSNENDADNNLSFLIWGTEVLENELAINEVMRIRGDETTLTKNMISKENEIYDIGNETNRWKDTLLKLLEMRTESQSKILELWGGK